MLSQTQTVGKRMLASVALHDAYTDFILSRQAKLCSPSTLRWYGFTTGRFCKWLETQGITDPAEVTARYVRAYLAELAPSMKDTTLNGHGRAIRTLLIFWHNEGYMPQRVKFDMPMLTKKRLPVLTADQLTNVVEACQNPRDKALILFLADTGLRRSEVIALRWEDIDMQTGLVRVECGKGSKARSAVVGATARRALLHYRRTLKNREERAPVFQTLHDLGFSKGGIQSIFYRLSEKTGIHITPHALRRTFCILSLRASMDVLHLQALLGHADLTMVKHYAQMVDDDLLQSHRDHSPVDNLSRLQKLT